MTIGANQVFRITYEAFSKYSNSLQRCRSLEDVAECFRVNLKYLFNFHIFRASYLRKGAFIHLMASAAKTNIIIEKEPAYLDYELELLQRNIPTRWTDLENMHLPQVFTEVQDKELTLWGWHIQNIDRQILVSVLSGAAKSFNKNDIPFVKLVAENLESKLVEICLYAELDEKNRKLQEAVKLINEQNEIINLIIEEQKKVISERTKEVEDKNVTLLEISVLNAHNVREPLSRIMGLVGLMDGEDSIELLNEILPKIKISGNDLDKALQQIIIRATIDLLQHKA